MNLGLYLYLSLVTGILFSVCKAEEPIDTIAFGSCLKQTRPQPIWESVRASKPDVFVLLGDNIYGDTKNMDTLKMKYWKLGSKKSYKNLKSKTPIIATWDDHDFGWNDTGKSYPFKEESKEK